jgi:hypothetical protein
MDNPAVASPLTCGCGLQPRAVQIGRRIKNAAMIPLNLDMTNSPNGNQVDSSSAVSLRRIKPNLAHVGPAFRPECGLKPAPTLWRRRGSRIVHSFPGGTFQANANLDKPGLQPGRISINRTLSSISTGRAITPDCRRLSGLKPGPTCFLGSCYFEPVCRP